MSIKVAITGNIGSGKSTVVEIFRKLNVPIFNSDEEAKKMYLEPKIKDEIRKLFGDKVFIGNDINKKALANLIFNDRLALLKINLLIHPLILQKYKEWHKKQNYFYTIKETAILFESHLELEFDKIITVACPEEIRILRVMKRDNVTREEVVRRIKNQLPEQIKCNLSDYIINNGIYSLEQQVLKIHNMLIHEEL